MHLLGEILCDILWGEIVDSFVFIFMNYREGVCVIGFVRRKEWEEKRLCPPS